MSVLSCLAPRRGTCNLNSQVSGMQSISTHVCQQDPKAATSSVQSNGILLFLAMTTWHVNRLSCRKFKYAVNLQLVCGQVGKLADSLRSVCSKLTENYCAGILAPVHPRPVKITSAGMVARHSKKLSPVHTEPNVPPFISNAKDKHPTFIFRS